MSPTFVLALSLGLPTSIENTTVFEIDVSRTFQTIELQRIKACAVAPAYNECTWDFNVLKYKTKEDLEEFYNTSDENTRSIILNRILERANAIERQYPVSMFKEKNSP